MYASLAFVVFIGGCSDSNSRPTVSSAPQTTPTQTEETSSNFEVSAGQIVAMNVPDVNACAASVEPVITDDSFEVRGEEFIFYITLQSNEQDIDVGASWIAAQIEWDQDKDGQPTTPFVVYAPFAVDGAESVVTLATSPRNELTPEDSVQVALLRMSSEGEFCWTNYKSETIIVDDWLPTEGVSADASTGDNSDSLSEISGAVTADGNYYAVTGALTFPDHGAYGCLIHESGEEKKIAIEASNWHTDTYAGEHTLEFWVGKDHVAKGDKFFVAISDTKCTNSQSDELKVISQEMTVS